MSQFDFQERKCIFWSILCSCDFFFFFYWPEWRCMEQECVCSVYSWWGLNPPPPKHTHTHAHINHSPPTPHGPRKAEWQGSGLAKWWNDDPIMRSDSKMRGIRQRLQPCSHCHTVLLLHTASCADDDWFAKDGSQEAPIDFSVFYQKYLFTVVSRAYPDLPHTPFFSKWGMV